MTSRSSGLALSMRSSVGIGRDRVGPAARRALAGMLLVVGLAGADAAVYRCGNSYADVPCPQAAVVDADDRRSDADRAAAEAVARREAALARQMVADREAAERLLQPHRRTPRVKSAERPAAPASSRSPSSTDRLRSDRADFVVVVPRPR